MKRIISYIIRKIIRLYNYIIAPLYGKLAPTSRISRFGVKIYNTKNLYLEDNTNIDTGAIIMNSRAKFIMKKNSGAAFGLTVVTGNHMSIPGMWFKQVTNEVKDKYDTDHLEDFDIIVEEDVWIGSNVTLLKGSYISRGAIIGSGSVVRKHVPPYAVVIGNPAKIVGFKFTPEEIIMHESILYPSDERYALDLLEKNYEKYFVKRISYIKNYLTQ